MASARGPPRSRHGASRAARGPRCGFDPASSASASASDLPSGRGASGSAGVAGGSCDCARAQKGDATEASASLGRPRVRRLIASIFAFLLSFAAVLPLSSRLAAAPSALALVALAVVAPSRVEDPAPTPPPAHVADVPPASRRRRAIPTDDASWGRYHSKRFLLSFPLPDGKAWRIDDHSRPSLFALHEATGSRVSVMTTQEDDLVNRQKCEERARALGWVTSKTLTTVDDQTTIGPEAYDSRIWVALDAAKPGGALEGHVYLFGAFIRRCLLMHVSTQRAPPRRTRTSSPSDSRSRVRASCARSRSIRRASPTTRRYRATSLKSGARSRRRSPKAFVAIAVRMRR